MVVLQVSRRRGALTRSLLEALLTTLKSSGHAITESRAMRAIDALLELDEDALTAAQAPDVSHTPRAPSLKVYGLPTVESHLHRLDLYSHDTQRMLIEIRTGLQAFNQYAEEATHYHFMLFGTGLSRESLELLKSNIETCYERAAEKASDLIARIAQLVQVPEMRAA
jgi:2-hydroxychromene-2-carboxylate isomerase